MSGRRLGELLVAAGAIDEDQLQRALQFQKGKRMKLGEALVHLRFTDEEQVARALAKQASLPFIDLGKGRIRTEVAELVDADTVARYRAMPILERDGALILAIDDPSAAFQLDDLSFVLNRPLKAAITTPSALRQRVREQYEIDLDRGVSTAAAPTAAEAKGEEDDEDAPIIRLVQHLVQSAHEARASDIHVEPQAQRVRVRFRVDGVLREVASHPLHLHGPLLSRLKLQAGMDISERRKPQDGRISIQLPRQSLDVRASVLPSNHGESMVMRLLDRERGLVSMAELGFDAEDQLRFDRIIKRPNGIVLVTGPTGSGKTTTLYAALQELNRPDRKLITAEDPVEYHIPGINQVQVRQRIGLNFARILRAMLRQAPNIILVGEIRDRETAEVAIQAALTGHLVFSTLHTNDAPSALTRLVDMGVQPFLVAASVVAVLAQRLVRQLCPECRTPYDAEEAELRSIGLGLDQVPDGSLYQGRGCENCEGSGFRGRKGVFELMELDAHLRDLTFKREPHLRIREEAIQTGRMTTLLHDGQRKVLSGTTTAREVLRVVTVSA